MLRQKKGGERGVWDLKLDTETNPFLSDHAFHGLVVAPGMLSAAVALALTNDQTEPSITTLEEFRFEQPVIIPKQGAPLAITLRPDGNRSLFAVSDAVGASAYVTGVLSTTDGSNTSPLTAEPKQNPPSADEFNGAEVYELFEAQQNSYGPSFQRIISAQISDREVRAVVAGPDEQLNRQWGVDPTVLDAFVQVLALANAHTKRTFTLRGFDQLQMLGDRLPESMNVRAKVTQVNGDSLIGDIAVTGSEGRLLLALRGVNLNFVDTDNTVRFCISANFTAEPIADPLSWWAGQFGMNADVQFAPYDQVFQELLDPGSLLRTNRAGTNVILLDLASWCSDKSRLGSNRSTEVQDSALAGLERYNVSPGVQIGSLNKYETQYLHKEIFVDRAYCRHGINFEGAECILDVGANIGLFSLFSESESPGVKVISFEPTPNVFEILAKNTKLYAPNAIAFNCGLSDVTGEAEFTYYENSSVFSTFHPDEKEDREAISAVVKNVLKDELGDVENIDLHTAELAEGRTDSRTFLCPLKTVSQVIREENLDRIDVLKVDAEKSELKVLQGIEDDHWPMIRQVVLEVHDSGKGEIEEACSILERQGFSVATEQEKLLERSGLYSVFAVRENAAPEVGQAPQNHLQQRVNEFVNALKVCSENSSNTTLVGLTPISPTLEFEEIQVAQSNIEQITSQMNNVHLLPAADLAQRYLINELYDPIGKAMGDVPFSQEAYAGLGTEVFRAYISLASIPKKVLVLDCDNTLWGGVCGEEDVSGLRIGDGYADLQKLAIRCRESGILICLVSKNVEEDVFRVFDERDDMVLKKEDLARWKINWEQKSQNLIQLASELNLGLDSFVFIDDNPIECAEVRDACPEVLTLQLPANTTEISHFAEHIWAVDRLQVTAEDRKRAGFYDEEKKRVQMQSAAVTLESFLESLELRIETFEPKPENLERLSQMTMRTNQFNFTTPRCSIDEVSQECTSSTSGWLLTQVSDKFGDYGIVGAVRYRQSETFVVDAFLLSCRVLGRGVEHRMLASVAEIAQQSGFATIDIKFVRTAKNQPAEKFLKQVIEDCSEKEKASVQDESEITLNTEKVSELVFDPTRSQAEDDSIVRRKTVNPEATAHYELLARIPAEHSSAGEILSSSVSAMVRPRPDLGTPFVAPKTTEEAQLAAVWARVLKLEKVGVHDDFFDLGGSSLLAVQVASELSAAMEQRVSTLALFEGNTVLGMLSAIQSEAPGAERDNLGSKSRRGKQRRDRRRYRDAQP